MIGPGRLPGLELDVREQVVMDGMGRFGDGTGLNDEGYATLRGAPGDGNKAGVPWPSTPKMFRGLYKKGLDLSTQAEKPLDAATLDQSFYNS